MSRSKVVRYASISSLSVSFVSWRLYLDQPWLLQLLLVSAVLAPVLVENTCICCWTSGSSFCFLCRSSFRRCRSSSSRRKRSSANSCMVTSVPLLNQELQHLSQRLHIPSRKGWLLQVISWRLVVTKVPSFRGMIFKSVMLVLVDGSENSSWSRSWHPIKVYRCHQV